MENSSLAKKAPEMNYICRQILQCKPCGIVSLSYCPMPISIQNLELWIPQTTKMDFLNLLFYKTSMTFVDIAASCSLFEYSSWILEQKIWKKLIFYILGWFSCWYEHKSSITWLGKLNRQYYHDKRRKSDSLHASNFINNLYLGQEIFCPNRKLLPTKL